MTTIRPITLPLAHAREVNISGRLTCDVYEIGNSQFRHRILKILCCLLFGMNAIDYLNLGSPI